MSFQGPGSGISGTSNQFSVGYAQSAGYATYAGSAGNINGYAPQAGYATYAGSAANINSYAPIAGYAYNLAVQGIGGSTWAWAGQPGYPGHYWGSNQGGYHAVWQMGQGYVGYAGSAGNINGYAPAAGYAYSSGAGTVRAWRSSTNGTAAGIQAWQGGAYGSIIVNVGAGSQAHVSGIACYATQFGIQGTNTVLLQSAGPGFIMAG